MVSNTNMKLWSVKWMDMLGPSWLVLMSAYARNAIHCSPSGLTCHQDIFPSYIRMWACHIMLFSLCHSVVYGYSWISVQKWITSIELCLLVYWLAVVGCHSLYGVQPFWACTELAARLPGGACFPFIIVGYWLCEGKACCLLWVQECYICPSVRNV